MRRPGVLGLAAASVCGLAVGVLAQAAAPYEGTMKADAILFLGNSITIVPPPNYWGASASSVDTDYAHRLTRGLNDVLKGSLALTPPQPPFGRWYAGDPGPDWDGNLLNIADVFERNYGTWDNARIRKQLALKAGIVILQFGENIPMATFDAAAFRQGLRSLMAGLKASSDPVIVVTSTILGANPTVDSIKREVCAEDPEHRMFVDLSTIGPDATGGAYGHPNDKAMAAIADRLLAAMRPRLRAGTAGGGERAEGQGER